MTAARRTVRDPLVGTGKAPVAGEGDHRGRRTQFELEGLHSAHRGDYRVVYRIDDQRRTVDILAIAHRSDVYRRG